MSAVMKYFTRERYEAVQTRSRAVDRTWERAVQEYSESLRLVQGRLPTAAVALAEETFHDAIVEAVERPGSSVVRVVLNADRNPWGYRGRLALRFEGVVTATFQEPKVGDCWLYEEVHVDPAGFAYRVLLRASELYVEAFGVEIETLSPAV